MNFVQSYQKRNPSYTQARIRMVKEISLYIIKVPAKESEISLQQWNWKGAPPCPHGIVQSDRVIQLIPWEYQSSYGRDKMSNVDIQLVLYVYENRRGELCRMEQAYTMAAQMCVLLCKKFGLDSRKHINYFYETGYRRSLQGRGRNRMQERILRAEEEVVFHSLPSFQVEVAVPVLYIRTGPSEQASVAAVTRKGDRHTVVMKINNWGKLEGRRGYLSLAYTKRV